MTRAERRRQRRGMERVKPSIPNICLFTWESQACQYPPTGPPGISYFRGEVWESQEGCEEVFVDCLLYRDRDGRLIGILNHYPVRIAFGPDPENVEEPGNVNTWVHPFCRRAGVATALHHAAWERWSIDYTRQRYTPAGLSFVKRLLEGRRDVPEHTCRQGRDRAGTPLPLGAVSPGPDGGGGRHAGRLGSDP